MLIILLFLVSVFYSIKHKSIGYLSAFHFVCFLAIALFICNGIDVQYKANISLPSDTDLYYSAFKATDDIRNYTFYQYPLALRIISFPVYNSLFAVWGQCVIIFFLLDIIVKKKENLIFFVLFHALIYTTTNLFKDNLILIFSLVGYILLDKSRRAWIQCIIIFVAISTIAWVRPFIGMALPITFIPFWFKLKSATLKQVLLYGSIVAAALVLYEKREFIQGVMDAFADDSSVQEGRASAPVAIVKVLAGPTPMHYFFADRFFAQPFLKEQGVFYTILHCCYYAAFAYWMSYLLLNFKECIRSLKKSVAKCFLLLLACSQLLCYVIIYGSADIRQRAIIITSLFLSTLIGKELFIRKMNRKQFRIWLFTISLLFILTIISS